MGSRLSHSATNSCVDIHDLCFVFLHILCVQFHKRSPRERLLRERTGVLRFPPKHSQPCVITYNYFSIAHSSALQQIHTHHMSVRRYRRVVDRLKRHGAPQTYNSHKLDHSLQLVWGFIRLPGRSSGSGVTRLPFFEFVCLDVALELRPPYLPYPYAPWSSESSSESTSSA